MSIGLPHVFIQANQFLIQISTIHITGLGSMGLCPVHFSVFRKLLTVDTFQMSHTDISRNQISILIDVTSQVDLENICHEVKEKPQRNNTIPHNPFLNRPVIIVKSFTSHPIYHKNHHYKLQGTHHHIHYGSKFDYLSYAAAVLEYLSMGIDHYPISSR